MNGTAAVKNSVEELIFNSRAEFEKRRWILATNIPDGVDLEDLKQTFLQGFDAIDLRLEKNSAFVLLGTPDQAINAINSLNGQSYHGFVIGVSLAPPDSLLFVGNLPFEFTEDQFRNLMSPFGPIERLFLVRSFFTGESKGYGFVDYINRESATQAKQQLMSKGSKYVGGRILRIDFAEANLLTYEDLHSKTLFVDRLPRDFTNAEVMRDLFNQSGTVTFAQVAVNQNGISRGFAFVDYATPEEAERGQKAHNGALLEDSHIRVAYGTPGRTGASILGGHHNTVGGQQRGPRPRGPASHEPQAVDMMGVRGPRPLMAPRPLMGSEPWQQMQRGHLAKPPRPLMRPGPAGPRPMMGRMRGPSPGGPRGAMLGHGPRPLLGRPPGPRQLTRQPAGPRGFVGVGVGGLPGVRPMVPRGLMQPRPLMDFGEQLDGTASAPDQMQLHVTPVGAEPSQQYTGETIPTLMGEPVLAGALPPGADPGVFGQTVQPMAQQQEMFVPPVQQPQGMLMPSQSQPGPRAGLPQMMQVQPVPAAPIATYTGALPAAVQTPGTVLPQAPPSVLVPTQQQAPNNQVLYASAPAAMPVQGVVPQVVPQDLSQYQQGVLPTNPGVTPAAPVTGQPDMNATPYAVPVMQPVSDPPGGAAVSSGYVVLPSDSTQQSGFYAPQEGQPYPMPQYTTAGQTATPQPLVQLPVGIQPGTVLQTQVPASQPSSVPMVAPQAPQYQWYQQVAPAVGTVPVSTPQLTQNQPLQGNQLPQGELVVSSHPATTVQSGSIYGQYHQPQLYQPQPGAVPGAETMVYYQQPQQQQQQQQLQPGMYPGVMETVPATAPQTYPSIAAVSGNENAVFPSASVAPQHSAPPVVYNSSQPAQLVAPGGPPQMSQKRAADGDAAQYGQQGLPNYFDANKRLRY